jgi:glutathione S-transferase
MANGTAIVTCLALLQYALVTGRVARARGKYNIEAPAITGHPLFERALRIQANTVEQLVLFLPSLWLFSFYVSSLWASLIGLIWVAGRILYMVNYTADPRKRGRGFKIALAANAVLLFGALIASILQLFESGF